MNKQLLPITIAAVLVATAENSTAGIIGNVGRIETTAIGTYFTAKQMSGYPVIVEFESQKEPFPDNTAYLRYTVNTERFLKATGTLGTPAIGESKIRYSLIYKRTAQTGGDNGERLFAESVPVVKESTWSYGQTWRVAESKWYYVREKEPPVWEIRVNAYATKGRGQGWMQPGSRDLFQSYVDALYDAEFYADFYDYYGRKLKYVRRKPKKITVDSDRVVETKVFVDTYPEQKMTTTVDQYLIARIRTTGPDGLFNLPVRYSVHSAAALSFFAADGDGEVREITGTEQSPEQLQLNTKIYAGANGEGIKLSNGQTVPINITIHML
ncbi:hypothetical protein [Escherichia coli]|uniref:hypothetical protein n=1 Tax=Escherichia coli TaxID=562 RepID=UPI0031B64078